MLYLLSVHGIADPDDWMTGCPDSGDMSRKMILNLRKSHAVSSGDNDSQNKTIYLSSAVARD